MGYFIHLNVRLSFGPLAWLIAGPQQHRIHHSRLPEHCDKNFGQFFPIWDVLFGTYYHARRDEFPDTGLVSGERVTSLYQALSLPFAKWQEIINSSRGLSSSNRRVF